jgi:transcriptional regulator with XRE-family HTH domain
VTLASLDTTARPLPASAPMLGSLIRKRRLQLGLTLRQLCERAGLSAGYLSQVENNKAVPALGTLAQIAAGLEVGLDYFCGAAEARRRIVKVQGRPRFSLPGSPVAYETISSAMQARSCPPTSFTSPPAMCPRQ